MYFSVIVTVYNVEPYLKQCVDSILSQTFSDFELILVDDGSLDKCPILCDEYAVRDKRVKIIHQKNKGVVNARKSGLLASKGRYIVFVDGDDWIDLSYLEQGYTLLEKCHLDMILFACSYEYGNFSEKVCEPAEEGLYEGISIRKRLYPAILMDLKMSHMLYSVCEKIFCRSLVENCFLTVNENVCLGEDMLSVLRAYLEAQRIKISHKVVYFYRIRRGSASHEFQIGYYKQVDLVLKELRKLSELSCELPVDFTRQVERYGAFMCFVLMIHAVNEGKVLYIGKIKRQMKGQLLQECIQQAQFKKITLKTRITYILFKRNMILCSYLFLRICRRIKKIFANSFCIDR